MERTEEYLEAIYDLQQETKKAVRTNDLAGKLGVKPSSVTEMLLKLSDKGYIEYQPYYGAVLTDKGLSVAKRIKKFHRIFEAFFTEFLGLDREEAHKLSCELEHHVNEDIADRICMLIASSDCSACRECDRSFYLLNQAPEGRLEVVVSPLIMRKLGFEPGNIIEKRGDDIYINGEEFRVQEDLSSKVVVKVLG